MADASAAAAALKASNLTSTSSLEPPKKKKTRQDTARELELGKKIRKTKAGTAAKNSKGSGQKDGGSSSSSSAESSEEGLSSDDSGEVAAVRAPLPLFGKEKVAYLEVETRALSSSDIAGLRQLLRSVMELPQALGKTSKNGGQQLRQWYESVKLGANQLQIIIKAVDRTQPDARNLIRRLKKARNWFSETFFSELGPDGCEAGYLDSLRCEFSEELPGKIFGPQNIRKLRSKIKSFQSANKSMKNLSASTIYNWQIRKRGFAAGKNDRQTTSLTKKPKYGQSSSSKKY